MESCGFGFNYKSSKRYNENVRFAVMQSKLYLRSLDWICIKE